MGIWTMGTRDRRRLPLSFAEPDHSPNSETSLILDVDSINGGVEDGRRVTPHSLLSHEEKDTRTSRHSQEAGKTEKEVVLKV